MSYVFNTSIFHAGLLYLLRRKETKNEKVHSSSKGINVKQLADGCEQNLRWLLSYSGYSGRFIRDLSILGAEVK